MENPTISFKINDQGNLIAVVGNTYVEVMLSESAAFEGTREGKSLRPVPRMMTPTWRTLIQTLRADVRNGYDHTNSIVMMSEGGLAHLMTQVPEFKDQVLAAIEKGAYQETTYGDKPAWEMFLNIDSKPYVMRLVFVNRFEIMKHSVFAFTTDKAGNII